MAVGRPEAGFGGAEACESLWLKAAALLESVARNHAFLDGHKRTAVIAAIHMLNLNGYHLVAEQCEIVNLALDTVEGTLTLQKIAEFFETACPATSVTPKSTEEQSRWTRSSQPSSSKPSSSD